MADDEDFIHKMTRETFEMVASSDEAPEILELTDEDLEGVLPFPSSDLVSGESVFEFLRELGVHFQEVEVNKNLGIISISIGSKKIHCPINWSIFENIYADFEAGTAISFYSLNKDFNIDYLYDALNIDHEYIEMCFCIEGKKILYFDFTEEDLEVKNKIVTFIEEKIFSLIKQEHEENPHAQAA